MMMLRSPYVLVVAAASICLVMSPPSTLARPSPARAHHHQSGSSRQNRKHIQTLSPSAQRKSRAFALWSMVQRDRRAHDDEADRQDGTSKKSNKSSAVNVLQEDDTFGAQESDPFASILDEFDENCSSATSNEYDHLSRSNTDRHPNGEEAATLISPPNSHVHSLLQIPCALSMQPNDEPYHSSAIYDPISTPSSTTRLLTIVDTGAQVTVLSHDAAQKAGLLHLMDRRYGGHAAGVGNCRVLGRIPANTLHLSIHGRVWKAPAILVLEHMQTGVELLLGLDFLRSTSATLSLSRNEMKLWGNGEHVAVPFLPSRDHQDDNDDDDMYSDDDEYDYQDEYSVFQERDTTHPPSRDDQRVSHATYRGDEDYAPDDEEEPIDMSGV